jgi:hypothetical protein
VSYVPTKFEKIGLPIIGSCLAIFGFYMMADTLKKAPSFSDAYAINYVEAPFSKCPKSIDDYARILIEQNEDALIEQMKFELKVQVKGMNLFIVKDNGTFKVKFPGLKKSECSDLMKKRYGECGDDLAIFEYSDMNCPA